MKRLRFVPLEERIVLDAAIGHDAAAASAATAAPPAAALLVVPTTLQDSAILTHAAKGDVLVVTYDPSTSTLDSLTSSISQALNGHKVDSIGLVAEGSPGKLTITNSVTAMDSSLSGNPMNAELVNFWHSLASFINPNGHVDLIACDVAASPVGEHFMQSIQSTLNEIGQGITVYGSTDATGSSLLGGNWVLESPHALDAGQLYFNTDALADWSHTLPIVNTFDVRYSTTTNGDIVYASNTILKAPTGTTVDSSTNNNDISMVYIDVDGNASTFNSSSATLDMPSGSTVLFAGLYWGGSLTGDANAPSPLLLNKVLLSGPSDSAYTQITASNVDTTLYSSHETGTALTAYQGFADVTAFVQSHGEGSYMLANMQISNGENSFGGWSLVIVFANSSVAAHNMTVYDGFNNVVPGGVDDPITLTGFQVPGTGLVDVHAGFIAYDGDAGGKGDFLSVQPTGGTSTKLSDALNPSNNFFNSTISTNGLYNSLKAPNFTNQLGYDAKVVDASDAFVNGQTGVDMTFASGGSDAYLAGVLTLSIEVPEAHLTVAKSYTDLTSQPDNAVHSGDIIEYTVTISSDGTAAAVDLSLSDLIPTGTTYVPGTLTIVSGANSGPVTDAIGDDQGQFSGSTVTFFLGAGANAFEGGSLAPGFSITVTFQVQVNSSVADNTTISNTATASYESVANDLTASGSVSFLVENGAPTAGNDQFSVNEDGTLTVNAPGILGNDSDPEHSISSIQLVSNVSNGMLTLNQDGSFIYKPNADFFGTDSFTYKVSDSSGNLSGLATVTLTVNPVNDAPSFTVGNNVNILEDAGPQTINNFITNISDGPANESAQTVSFIVTNDNNALFSGQPTIDAQGNLIFTAAPNAFGTATISVQAKDSGGTTNGGVDTSAIQTFTITVGAVNDAPSFTVGNNVSVLEDAGTQTINNFITNISNGPANESGQTVSFIVTNNNNALFSGQPTIDAQGNLIFTAAPDAFGTAIISVQAKDSGGTTSGGADTSAIQTFTITVGAVNDAPSIEIGNNVTILEDAGPQTVNQFVSFVSTGPDNESAQTVSYIVGNDNNGLFSVQPTIDAQGNLIFTAAPDAFGTATITVQAKDSGGTNNGGIDTSGVQSFTITVGPVNDAPSFTGGSDQTAEEGSGNHIVPNFLTNISVGPSNEANQLIQFNVTTNNPSLFTEQPSIDAFGNLQYILAPNQSGTAIITIVAQDNGGTANGGIDTSSAHQFTLTVAPTQTGVSTPPSISTSSSTATPPAPQQPTFEPFAEQIHLNEESFAAKAQPISLPAAPGHIEPLQLPPIVHSTSIVPITTMQPILETSREALTIVSSEKHEMASESLNLGFIAPEERVPQATAAIAAMAVIGDISYPGLNRRTSAAIPLRIDMAGVVVTPERDPRTWKNGDPLIVNISLTSMPTATVIVTLKSSDPSLGVVSPREVIFSPSNWNSIQSVEVTGMGDQAQPLEYSLEVLPVESSDPNYRELAVEPVQIFSGRNHNSDAA